LLFYYSSFFHLLLFLPLTSLLLLFLWYSSSFIFLRPLLFLLILLLQSLLLFILLILLLLFLFLLHILYKSSYCTATLFNLAPALPCNLCPPKFPPLTSPHLHLASFCNSLPSTSTPPHHPRIKIHPMKAARFLCILIGFLDTYLFLDTLLESQRSAIIIFR